MMNIVYESTLCHYGIPGMRWGVRRASKSFGSRSGASKSTKGMSDDAKTAAKLKKKKPHQLSNQELKTLNERTRLEKEYKSLNPSKIKKGMAIAGTVAAAMGTAVTLYNNGSKIVSIGKDITSRMSK